MITLRDLGPNAQGVNNYWINNYGINNYGIDDAATGVCLRDTSRMAAFLRAATIVVVVALVAAVLVLAAELLVDLRTTGVTS